MFLPHITHTQSATVAARMESAAVPLDNPQPLAVWEYVNAKPGPQREPNGAFAVPNILQSLAADYFAGNISLEAVAAELCRAGWTNFVNLEFARKTMERERPAEPATAWEIDPAELAEMRRLAHREANFQAWKNGRETVYPVTLADDGSKAEPLSPSPAVFLAETEPQPATDPEPAAELSGMLTRDDSEDTFEDFETREAAVVAFGRQLEAVRVATIQGICYTIAPRPESAEFQIEVTDADGMTETICSGFYGFEFNTFERTVSYAVQRARERFVVHPETVCANGCQIERRYHKRRAAWVYAVTFAEPLSGSKFKTQETRAKRCGGWYSREYRPEFQRGAFLFLSMRDADRFANDYRPAVPRTVRESVPAAVPQPSPAGFLDDREPVRPSARETLLHAMAQKLETLADGMQATIDHKTRPMTQNWTRKRGAEYASRMHDGENLQRCQQALRVLAKHWQAGTIPDGLRHLSAKSHVMPLVSEYRERENGRPFVGDERYHNNTDAAKQLRDLIAQDRNPGTAAEREALAKRKAIETAENRLRHCDSPGFFPTKPAFADKVIEAAELPQSPPDDFFILEPSAGIGSLCDAIVRHSGALAEVIDTVEVYNSAAEVVELKGFGPTVCTDFLTIDPDQWGRSYDCIVMNPPFEQLQDIEHLQHAFRFLKPGGRLVAIMSDGSFYSTTRNKVRDFGDWLESLGAWFVPADDGNDTHRGAFSGADAFRQTGVNVRIVVIDKPA